MNSELIRRTGLGLLLAALGGCGHSQGALFEPLEDSPRWPPAPQSVRIEYVGRLATDQDLNPSRSFFDDVGAHLFGAAPVNSMLSPYALCSDASGRLFVADTNAQAIHVFDLTTRRYERWPTGDDPPQMAQPLGVAWDERGRRLFVADGAAGRLLELDEQGRVRGAFGPDLSRPCGVAVDAERDRIIVVEVAAHRLAILDGEGRLVQTVGERGVALGQFNFPTNVSIDAQGRVYVSDSLNFRVQRFDADLTPMSAVGSQGDRPGYFSQPKGVAVDGDGHLYVVDAHFESVQIFDDTGQLLLNFGHEGQGPGEFWLPAGIHVDSDNRIWIADSYNRRVQVFQYWPEPTP